MSHDFLVLVETSNLHENSRDILECQSVLCMYLLLSMNDHFSKIEVLVPDDRTFNVPYETCLLFLWSKIKMRFYVSLCLVTIFHEQILLKNGCYLKILQRLQFQF